MKNVARLLLVAVALGASGAYAQSTYNSQQSAAKYEASTPEGNSANWGVGG
jgi:hypothetical protein